MEDEPAVTGPAPSSAQISAPRRPRRRAELRSSFSGKPAKMIRPRRDVENLDQLLRHLPVPDDRHLATGKGKKPLVVKLSQLLAAVSCCRPRRPLQGSADNRASRSAIACRSPDRAGPRSDARGARAETRPAARVEARAPGGCPSSRRHSTSAFAGQPPMPDSCRHSAAHARNIVEQDRVELLQQAFDKAALDRLRSRSASPVGTDLVELRQLRIARIDVDVDVRQAKQLARARRYARNRGSTRHREG